jgi:hypothetical protein
VLLFFVFANGVDAIGYWACLFFPVEVAPGEFEPQIDGWYITRFSVMALGL